MAYQVLILPRAQKALAQLHGSPAYDRLVTAIRGLTDTPRPPGCIKLSGQPAWRIRVGDYRIICDPDPRYLVQQNKARVAPDIAVGSSH